ncbi:hypothetical protein LCGC14_1813750 [marine sediment metagenome]|uniref:Uncharacterized protein n=1 Tax=marine sediment metagenome TaxID=412755 RepID=A0A0F9GL49_9ZZZZ
MNLRMATALPNGATLITASRLAEATCHFKRSLKSQSRLTGASHWIGMASSREEAIQLKNADSSVARGAIGIIEIRIKGQDDEPHRQFLCWIGSGGQR